MVNFPESDHRNYNRNGEFFNVGETFAGLPFEKGVELTEMLKEFLPEEMTLPQMALRWILDHDAVSAIIPGASSPHQAQRNTLVSGLPTLSEDVHRVLSEFYTSDIHQHIRGPY